MPFYWRVFGLFCITRCFKFGDELRGFDAGFSIWERTLYLPYCKVQYSYRNKPQYARFGGGGGNSKMRFLILKQIANL